MRAPSGPPADEAHASGADLTWEPRTSKKHPEHTIYPYLLKGLAITRPNQVWCTDISYIPMRRGFLCLVAIMDWHSRKVLCWRPSNFRDTSLCVDGAGLLRYMQAAHVEVMEVTAPDRHDRRKRGKNDDLDAQNAAHAAFAGQRTVTLRSRNGMVESLRVLRVCRKTAVNARRIALQMIQATIIAAPDGLRDQLRQMTRMQLIRFLAALRPDLSTYRDLEAAYHISLKSLGTAISGTT